MNEVTPPPRVLAGSHDPLLDWALRESGCGIATYFDGSLDETAVAVSLPLLPGVDLAIGADNEGSQHFFTGSIDGVAIYDQALTVDQIRESY